MVAMALPFKIEMKTKDTKLSVYLQPEHVVGYLGWHQLLKIIKMADGAVTLQIDMEHY